MATREHIKIAAKLYECQESAKKLFQEEYSQKIQWYIDTILRWNKERGTDTLKTVLAICQMQSVQSNGMAMMLFLAAAVELIEKEPEL